MQYYRSTEPSLITYKIVTIPLSHIHKKGGKKMYPEYFLYSNDFICLQHRKMK